MGFDIGGIAPVKLDVTDRNSIIAAAVSSADTTVRLITRGIGGIVPAGREGGRHSMEQMTEVKWVTVQMGQRQFPFLKSTEHEHHSWNALYQSRSV